MAYDPNNSYVSWDEVKGRLTQHGAESVLDADEAEGVVSEDELESYFYPAAQWADNKVDEAIHPHYNLASGRPLTNSWLRDRALDLCVYRAHTLGGEDDTEALKEAFQAALDDLEKVRTGAIAVPGLDVSTDDGVTDLGRIGPSIAAVKNLVPRHRIRRGKF